MASLDVFHSDAFTMLQMTTAVEAVPYRPEGIGSLGIFEPDPIRTKALSVERRDGVLTLIPISDRGAPLPQRTTEVRNVKYFETPRVAKEDTLYAHEIADIREFGEETDVIQVQREIRRRLEGPTGLLRDIEYTWENQRLGAIQGSVVDADGKSVIYNWFTEFGVTQPAEIGFNLTSLTPGAFRTLCNTTVRSIKRAAKGAFVDGVTTVMAACGDTFWDQLVTNADVTATYVNWRDAAQLRNALGAAFRGGEGTEATPRLDTFDFGGISWFNYRGSDDNSSVAIAPTKVKFFLKNAPGVFKWAMSPHPAGPFLGTPGRRYYVVPHFDIQGQEWWQMKVYSYPLFICTRPETLFSGRSGA